MQTQWFKRIDPVLGLLAYCAASCAWATPLSVTVVDANGMLVDAVVSLEQARPVAAGGAPRTVEMDQVNSQFVPAVLAVRTGTLVRFPNNDQIRHQVYSFSAAKRFELPLFQGSTAAPVRFDQAGLVTVGCNIHDWMLGYIYVTQDPWYGVTDSKGQVTFANLPTGSYSLTLWHPQRADLQPQAGGNLMITQAPVSKVFTLAVQPLASDAPVPPTSPFGDAFGKALRENKE